ncbi:MAG: hypothetical protein QX196_15985 [Methylococcaceae bacterium]
MAEPFRSTNKVTNSCKRFCFIWQQPDALHNQRIIMSHFFQQIEAALLPAAIPYTPEYTYSKEVS